MLIPAAAYRRGLTKGDPSPFYSLGQSKQSAVDALLQKSGNLSQLNDLSVAVDPKHDWASKALQAGTDANKIVGQSSQNAIQNQLAIQAKQLKRSQRKLNKVSNMSLGAGQVGLVSGGPGLKGNTSALMRALGLQESGGNYGAVNSGSGALGKYQVMPSNVAGWSQQALGHAITTTQFLHNPKYQEQIVSKIFGDYVKKYGAKGALSAWYSGDPNKYNNSSPQSGGPSIRDYVNQVLGKM